MVENNLEQERIKLELERLRLERERLEFEQKKRGETLLVKNFGSILIGIISFFAFLVSATQAYIAWQQRRLTEAQTVERFIPHLIKSDSRTLALTTMKSFVDSELVLTLAANLESSPTLEKYAKQGSPEEKQVAQQALDELANRRSSLISQMFSDDKNTRIAATTTLAREWNADPKVIAEALAFANSHRTSKSGIINTLVLFQSFHPLLLKPHYEDLINFLDSVKDNGDQTKEQAKRVRDLLEKPVVVRTDSVVITPEG